RQARCTATTWSQTEKRARNLFLQAGDGIPHGHVTAVQTCALPTLHDHAHRDARVVPRLLDERDRAARAPRRARWAQARAPPHLEIGRASCRERALFSGVLGSLKNNR